MKTMTENEARCLLGQSPTETAAQMLWAFGREKAKRIVAGRISIIVHMSAPLSIGASFWSTVLRRLDTIDPISYAVGPFEMARLQQLERFS